MRNKHSIVYLGFWILNSLCSLAFSDDRIPNISAHWVGETGGIIDQVSGIETAWGWDVQEGHTPAPALLIKLSARIPQYWRMVSARGEHVRLIGRARIKNMSADIQQLRLALTSSLAVLDVEFITPAGPKKLSLALTATHAEPAIVNFENCTEYSKDFKIKLNPITRQGRHLFIALSCVEDQNSVELRFYRSSDAKWAVGNLDQTKSQPAFRYRFAKPAYITTYAGELLKVKTRDEDGRLIEYSVTQEPRDLPRRWDLNAGLSWSYLSYKERLGDIRVSQMAFTGKMSFIFRIIPRTLTSDITVFKTLFTFAKSPDTLSDSKFLGINGRLGYRLPIELGATEWFFFAGWYRWSMDVAGDAYGVNPLSGPQIFVQRNHSERGKLPYWIYFKFATISDSGNFTKFGNNELAIGASLGLSSNPRPFLASLDIARTAFTKTKNGFENSMTLTSVSLGISKRF